MFATKTVINDRKIRFAVAGCGRISKNHFDALKKHSESTHTENSYNTAAKTPQEKSDLGQIHTGKFVAALQPDLRNPSNKDYHRGWRCIGT